MLKRTIGSIALGAAGLTGTLFACGSPPAANPATTTSATVSVDVYDAASTKVETCIGTMISADAVLTAGHCASGFASWQVTSATGKVLHSTVAYTYDWQNFKSDMSHPDHDDVAVLKLDGQIPLASYPKLAPSALASGTAAMRVRAASSGGFEAIGVMAYDGAAVGFPHYYFTSIDGSEALMPGGALIDPNANVIYGVASGVGATTKNLYLSRVEMVTAWLQTMASCSTGSSSDVVVECHTGSSSGSSSGSSNSSSNGSSSSGSSSSGSSSGSTSSGSSSGSTSSGSSSGSTSSGSSSGSTSSGSTSGSSSGFTGDGVPPTPVGCGGNGGSCQGSGCSPSGGGNGANSSSGGGSGGGGTSSGTGSGSNGTNTGTSSGGTTATGTSSGTSSGANGTSSGTSSGGNGDTGNGSDGPGCTDSSCGGCGDDPTCSDNTEDFGGVPGTSQGSASATPH